MHTVAVLDDDQQVRQSMERLLRSAGYEVAQFAGGTEFLDSLGRSRPDCLLVDGKMPGMSGREVLERLSRHPARVPAIVVSGHDSPADRAAAAALGATAFFGKPFDPDALLASVAAAIAARGTP